MYKCNKCGNERCDISFMNVGRVLTKSQVLSLSEKDMKYVYNDNKQIIVKDEFLFCNCGVCGYTFTKDVVEKDSSDEELIKNMEKDFNKLSENAGEIIKNVEKDFNKLSTAFSAGINEFQKKYTELFEKDKS